jgi:hypothetical protein
MKYLFPVLVLFLSGYVDAAEKPAPIFLSCDMKSNPIICVPGKLPIGSTPNVNIYYQPPAQTPCEQKMEAAMRAMDWFIGIDVQRYEGEQFFRKQAQLRAAEKLWQDARSQCYQQEPQP